MKERLVKYKRGKLTMKEGLSVKKKWLSMKEVVKYKRGVYPYVQPQAPAKKNTPCLDPPRPSFFYPS